MAVVPPRQTLTLHFCNTKGQTAKKQPVIPEGHLTQATTAAFSFGGEKDVPSWLYPTPLLGHLENPMVCSTLHTALHPHQSSLLQPTLEVYSEEFKMEHRCRVIWPEIPCLCTQYHGCLQQTPVQFLGQVHHPLSQHILGPDYSLHTRLAEGRHHPPP